MSESGLHGEKRNDNFSGSLLWLLAQQPKALYRKLVERSGTVQIARGRRIVVTFDCRSHNSILREAQLDETCSAIPWLSKHRVEFSYA